jgi:predicted xylose isomerase-like sugar epimerase
MLFILAMEPLHHMLDHAAMQGLLSPLAGRGAKLRVSLYADDAAIFVNPQKDDLQTVADVLQLFGEVSGLKTEYREMRCLSHPV